MKTKRTQTRGGTSVLTARRNGKTSNSRQDIKVHTQRWAMVAVLAIVMGLLTATASADPVLTSVTDTNWYTCSTSYGASIAVDSGTETLRHVVGTNTTVTPWRTHAWGNFPSVNLKSIGERIELAMHVKVDSNAVLFNYVLRLGLLNSRGTPGTASHTGNSHPVARRNNVGVVMATSIADASVDNPISIYGMDYNWHPSEIPFSRRDFFADGHGSGRLGDNVEGVALVPGTEHAFRFAVERTAEQELSLKAWLDGALMDGGRTLDYTTATNAPQNISGDLTVTEFLTFNEVLMGYTLSTSTQFGIEYSDLKVDYFPVQQGTVLMIR